MKNTSAVIIGIFETLRCFALDRFLFFIFSVNKYSKGLFLGMLSLMFVDKANGESEISQSLKDIANHIEEWSTDPELPSLKINLFNVVSGRTDATHLLSLNVGSLEELGRLMDRLSSAIGIMQLSEQSEESVKVVSRSIFREL